MTSLRTVLAFNMKEQRHILRITQAQLAERVDTSTNYIALIESKKKFPTPEMLERIAAALEIDAPALFSTKSGLNPEDRVMAEVQERVLDDLTRIIAYRIGQFNKETPPDNTPGTDKGHKK
jgi:transcriptional regulator with XRE-family HTH domain